jgi:hypothetical protein
MLTTGLNARPRLGSPPGARPVHRASLPTRGVLVRARGAFLSFDVPDFAEAIARVIDTPAPLEGAIRDRRGRCYSPRIRPYVTLENKIEGPSITLLDIDSIKRGLERRPAES